MRVDVLGPVAVHAGDGTADIGGPRQRAVLAVLGLLAGSVVTTAALADAVWSGSPPRTAGHTLQNYVLRLRRLGLTITRVGDGYRLDTETDASAVTAALRSGVGVAAALALVRGRPGEDLTDPDLVRARCAELTEIIEALRERAAADSLDAAADPAAAAQLIPELRGLVMAEPYRERRWELLMLGLYRAGRQSDALDAFAEARSRLTDDLGIEPGAALRRMQQAVLSQDPALSASGRDPSPPAVTGGGRALPGIATRLVGRDADLHTVDAALAGSRLVSLVGPLGAGKTRLALEVARRREGSAWFVPLEGIERPTTVADCLLAAVAPTSRAAEALQGAVDALATSDGLLVLDGAETAIEQVRRVASALLAAAPELRILVTSRQGLRVHDEATVPLAALAPADRRTLLVDRARLADPAFVLAAADVAMADRLCELVDGLPLGIELVARHLRLMSVGELTARVDADLDRWTSGAGAEATGLVGAVAASVDELPDATRRLLLGLAVLPAEADVGLVHQVGAPAVADDDVFEMLASLVDRSLVQVRAGPTGIRYGVLLSVRRHCLDLLVERDRRRIEERYVAAVLRRATQRAAELRTPQRSAVLAALDADEPHLRAALASCVDHGNATEALAVATGLADFWLARRPSEGMAWLQRLLAGSTVDGADRAAALLQLGHFAYWLTEFDLGLRLLLEARQLLDGADRPILLGQVLRRMGAIAAATDDIERARGWLEESAMVLAAGDDEVEEALSLLHLGSLLADESRADEALPILIRAREALRRAGDPLQEGHALAALTLAWWKAGDLRAARGAGERALERFQLLGHRPTEGVVAGRLAAITRALGDPAESDRLVAVTITAGRASGTRTTVALGLLARARLALDTADVDAAAADIGDALEAIDVVADRWVFAEALEAAARLEAARGRAAAPILARAAELRAAIGQPPPPDAAAEIGSLLAADPIGAGSPAGLHPPPVDAPAALRAWVRETCAAGGAEPPGTLRRAAAGTRLDR